MLQTLRLSSNRLTGEERVKNRMFMTLILYVVGELYRTFLSPRSCFLCVAPLCRAHTQEARRAEGVANISAWKQPVKW